MITPEIKDRVLFALTQFPEYRCLSTDIRLDGVSHNAICAILRQMTYEGLIEIKDIYRGTLQVSISSRVDELLSRGGYAARELLLKANLDKLGKELDLLANQLDPSLLDTADKLSKLASVVSTALGLFM